MFLNTIGRIGIGNGKPKAHLHIWADNVSALNNQSADNQENSLLVGPYMFESTNNSGSIKTSGLESGFYFMDRSITSDIVGASTAGTAWTWYANNTNAILSTGTTGDVMTIRKDGNVGIGVSNPTAKLVVNGTICSRELRVSLSANPCDVPDYVFEKDYHLKSLKELEEFVKLNKHLPGIPNAKNIGEEGMLIGSMNLKLLEKIEELTLYTIELQKQVKDLQSTFKSIKK